MGAGGALGEGTGALKREQDPIFPILKGLSASSKSSEIFNPQDESGGDAKFSRRAMWGSVVVDAMTRDSPSCCTLFIPGVSAAERARFVLSFASRNRCPIYKQANQHCILCLPGYPIPDFPVTVTLCSLGRSGCQK